MISSRTTAMMTYKPYVLFFWGCCQFVFGQTNEPSTGKIDRIPFQLTEFNNISVRATLNEQDTVNLMFHTAANAVTLTEDAIKKLKTFIVKGADSVKSWGGSGNTSRFSNRNSLQIGTLKWTAVPIWENKNSGPKTDGKFGIDLFTDKIVELDFDKRQIVLYPSLPDKVKEYEKRKLIRENDLLFVEAVCQVGANRLTNKFLLHSGYSGALLFDDAFVKDNKLDDNLAIVAEKELTDSFGNVLKTKQAILPTFQLGNEQLAQVPVGFFTGAIGGQKMSVIGGDILKRFTVILDLKGESIYLKANTLRKAAYFGG